MSSSTSSSSNPPPPLPFGWIRRPADNVFSDKPFFSKGALFIKMLVIEINSFPPYFSFAAGGGKGIWLAVPPKDDGTGTKVLVIPPDGKISSLYHQKLMNEPAPPLPRDYQTWVDNLVPEDIELPPEKPVVVPKPKQQPIIPPSTPVNIPKQNITLNKVTPSTITLKPTKPKIVEPAPTLRNVIKETGTAEILPTFPDRVRMTKPEPKLTLMAPDWTEKVRDGDYVRFIQRDTKQIVSDIWLEELDEDNEDGLPYYTTYWSFAKRLRSTRRPESNDRIILLAYTEGDIERQYPDDELVVNYETIQKIIKAEANPSSSNTAFASSSTTTTSTSSIATGTVSAARARLNAVMQTALATNAFSRVARNNTGTRKKAIFTMPEGWTKTTTDDGDTCFVDLEGNALWILWHQVTEADGRTIWWDCDSQQVYYERPNIADDDGAAAIVNSTGERISTQAKADSIENQTISAAEFDLADALAKVGTALFAHGDHLRAVFVSIDTDGNGLLDVDEFTAALDNLNMNFTNDQCLSIFNLIDDNNSGNINYKEFLMAFKDAAEAAAQAQAALTNDESEITSTEEDTLPEGWTAVTDEAGDTYYYNAETGEAVWERPT